MRGLPNAKQPRKALYLTYALVSLVVKLPFYVLECIFSRPVSNWSFRKAFHLRMLKWFISVNNQVGEVIPPFNHLKVIPKPHKSVAGVWIDPVDAKLMPADIKAFAEKANVTAVRIPGYWYHHKGQAILGGAKASTGEQVIYYLHGGGFIHQSAHPADLVATCATGTLKAIPTIKRLLSLEYRLSSGPPVTAAINPFPAALLDALAGYSYLINELGFQPQNIIIGGDSCGANLALALVKCLREVGTLAVPGGLLLYSPWADIGSSHYEPDSSVFNFAHIDYTADYVKEMWATSVYTAPFGREFCSTNPYVSPASKSIPSSLQMNMFKGFPKTLMISGDSEQLIDSIRTLRQRMEADIGKEKVTYVEIKDAIHDILAFTWFQPERRQVQNRVTEWYSTL